MKTVMVVDDNPSIREMFRALLCGLGYRPILMENGKEATIYIKEYKPDLIITDYDMGSWPNWIIFARFAKQECKIKVIMISANEKAKEIADKEGIHFLEKPFDFVKLKELISKLLKGGEESGECH